MSLLFSLVGLLPLFIGIVFLFKSTEDVIKDEACNNLGRLVKNVREELCRFLCGCVVDMNMLAESEGMKDPDVSVDKKLLEMKKIQEYYKRFEDITLVDTKGRVITSTTYNYRGEWKSKKWFQEAAEGKVYISDAHIVLDPYKVVVAIAVPLTDDRGRIQSVMVGQLNMERVWGIVDSIKVGNTGYVAIVNDQNFFIAHPHKEHLFQPAPFEMDKQFGMVYPKKLKSETLIYSAGKFLCNSDYQFP
ncbi:MAG: cache domain-containing protein, partial [Planctomycetes bacterium]|nr:cache domain-containing protein [Planctomycetota bacterium]